MFQSLSRLSRLSLTAVWCALVAVTLWRLSPEVPAMALVSATVIGVMPALVVFVLARRPERTLSELVHATYEGGS